MAEYIERDVLIEEAEQDSNLRFIVPLDKIKKIPTADVKPVKYGSWIWKGNDKGYFCSVCNSGCLLNMESDWHTSLFCPNCGAKMGLKGR